MRDSPAFQVTVRRMGAWQGAVAFCIGAALIALALWWWQREALAVVERALAALSCLLALGALPLLRALPVSLRWDSQRWWIDSPHGLTAEREVARLDAVIGLSFWMLLRVRLKDAPPWAAIRWVPVQRRGLEDRWHALRCAIHTSPAVVADDPPQVPSC